MSADDKARRYRRDMLSASALLGTGLIVSVLSVTQIRAQYAQQVAQATPPTQSTPGAESKPTAPSEPVTTGTRPAEIAPEPARPDEDALKAGAKPALPPAPAEKVAPPIKDR